MDRVMVIVKQAGVDVFPFRGAQLCMRRTRVPIGEPSIPKSTARVFERIQYPPNGPRLTRKQTLEGRMVLS